MLTTQYNFSDITTEFSMCFWMKINALATQWDCIVRYHLNESLFSFFRYNQTSNIQLCIFNSTALFNTHLNGIFVADNIWKHITLTLEKSGTAVKITSYLNGVFNNTSTSGTWNTSGITALHFFRNNANINFTFQGNLDDFRMYNKVLRLREDALADHTRNN